MCFKKNNIPCDYEKWCENVMNVLLKVLKLKGDGLIKTN